MSRHFRSIAGNIELFLGAYLVTFGFLAALFFARVANRNAVLLSSAGMLIGGLLVLRARRLLAWNRWLFWIVAVLMISVPIVWFTPVLLRIR